MSLTWLAVGTAVGLVLFVLGIGVVGVSSAGDLVRRRAVRVSELEDRLGLQRDGLEFRGTVQGFEVVLREEQGLGEDPSLQQVQVRVPLLEELLAFRPRGAKDKMNALLGNKPAVTIGHRRLDGLWRVYGPESTVRGIFLDPDVGAALEPFIGLGRFDGRTFTGIRKGLLSEDSRRLVDDAVRLALAIEAARAGPWEALAEELDLLLTQQARAIEGDVDGVRLTVFEVDEPDGVATEIRVPLSRPLPEGTRIVREGEGVRLGDPVLDGHIAVHGDADLLGPLLCHDDARAAAMGAIHAHPASEVTPTRVIVHARGRLLTELADTVDDALTLAKALSAHDVEDFEVPSEVR